jgi:hypothetical protein
LTAIGPDGQLALDETEASGQSAPSAGLVAARAEEPTLALIQQPPDGRDLDLSLRMRESVLAAIAEPSAPPVEKSELAVALETYTWALDDDGSARTRGERAIMPELLGRLAAPTRLR